MQSTNDLLNILRRIKNFTELEKELANISNDKEKGDLFELFCQVYLKVVYKKQLFKSIQLFKDIDASTLQKLNLRLGKDYGIDIVAITDSDDLWTIQVKFRQSDQLTWTELSTFRASSEKASFTLVMSNVSKVNHPHQILNNFSSILKNEFESLTKEDFSNIRTFLKGQKIKPVIYTPRPHQIEAIQKAFNHFKINNLGQMIHACGTGKTLTALWIKENLKPKNTIVYVPGLALLKQTLEEWTKHKSTNFSIKCVCSDQSVSISAQEIDESVIDITELGVPVTTNPKDIIEFLKSSDKDKVIFSTYQSSPVINNALGSLPSFSFDFGIFDEAHRTASKSEHLFTKSLNTPVRKKLFMTATPKLYAPNLKTRAKEEDILLCSMDDPSIYGEIFHEIKFGEAIKLNLLSDYKIKVITVTNDEIKELIDRRYWIDLLGKEITADELAKVWALLKSLNETNHIISFHSRIYRAKEFQSLVENTIELLKSNKKEVEDLKTYHISGEYPTYQRSKILAEFILQNKSLVTNARCLTEGVDVPAIDGVYFVDPKQNIIDIVQAVGRAIRKKVTKYGYIIIPVFIKDETDVEKIIQGSAFRQVWDIVEAMKDQDARLSHIIEELQELRGKKKFGSLKSRDQAEERALRADLGNIFDLTDSILPKKIDIIEFVEKIGIKTLDIIGQSWDERFGEYKAFKEKNNREPSSESKDETEKTIGLWAQHQRQNYRKKKEITIERIDKLNAIGFDWNPLETAWNEGFKDYVLFRRTHNREPTEESKDESEKSIGRWAGSQRRNYRTNKLLNERVNKLNSISFIWRPIENAWNQGFNKYKEFKEKYKREPTNSSKDNEEKFLASWAGNQREINNKNKLSRDKFEKLDKIGFIWTKRSDWWEQSFKDYILFKSKYKREPSQVSKNEQEKNLAKWVSHQRQNYKRKEKITQERIDRLTKMNFIWDIKEENWNQMFKEYTSFLEKHGRKPTGSLSKNKIEQSLAHWVGLQKQMYSAGKLSKYRLNTLNSIGFSWGSLDASWKKSFEEYVKFRKKYNHEPFNSSKSKSERFLAHWAISQRQNYKKNKLSKERKDLLNSIGFIWNKLEDLWQQPFNEYRVFKEKNGRKPMETSKDKSEKRLGAWASKQIVSYNKNKLSKDRINKLNSIGFQWSVKAIKVKV